MENKDGRIKSFVEGLRDGVPAVEPESEVSDEPSEFGSGLAVCLVKFNEHFSNDVMRRILHIEWWLKNRNRDLSQYASIMRLDIELFQHVELEVYRDERVAFSHLIETWANGASDHLYEIRVPKGLKLTRLGKMVAELQELGLRMGHGFGAEIWTMEHVERLKALVKEIAMEIDRRLGLEPDWGRW